MTDRDEKYIIHAETGARAAVPNKHFEDVLKADGWVIDPDGPSAADADPKTVKAAEKTLARAETKRTEPVELEG